MPQIANITILKSDGTTNIVWSGKQASAGDKSPAVFRSETVGTAIAHQPTLKITSRDNGAGTARRLEWDFVYPEVVTGSDAIPRIINRAVANGSFLNPSGMAKTATKEAAYQMCNLVGALLFKQMLEEGYAAT